VVSSASPGLSIILQNDANYPFPGGDPPDKDTTAQIMKFTVPADVRPPVRSPKLPIILNSIPRLKPDSPGRVLTLVEIMGPAGPEAVLLDGQKWSAEVSELPRAGSTEEWEIVNLTGDTHPIHLHLIQFQIFNRQNMKTDEYKAKWEELNGGMPPFDHPTQALPAGEFTDGPPIPPDENEKGWKDTARMNPGQVTRIRIRFTPQDVPPVCAKPGKNLFPFDPTVGPGYVWHCHILDHEDNEMMRPYKVKK
jgi:FtsP/CotA-like multicopper oxidase with cupredoxin domain